MSTLESHRIDSPEAQEAQGAQDVHETRDAYGTHLAHEHDSLSSDQIEKAFSAVVDALRLHLADLDRPSLDDHETITEGSRGVYNAGGGSDGEDGYDGDNDDGDDDNKDRIAVGSDNIGASDDVVAIAIAGNDAVVTADDAERMEKRKQDIDLKLRATIRNALRDSLLYDPYVIETAEEFNIPEDERITMDKKNRLVFHLKDNCFADWKGRHQLGIGISYTPHGKPRPYSTNVRQDSSQGKKERAGQIITRFNCQCRGTKSEVKGRVLGGTSGKTRQRAASLRCSCTAYFNAIHRPTPTFDGRLGNTYRIEYNYRHNHTLGEKGDIRTIQKSDAIKERIKAMILREMTIPEIVDQLTIDHSKLTRLLDFGDNGQLSMTENPITYDDVNGLLYALTTTKTRKNEKPTISARLWMEELKGQGYFTYYDQRHGLYHGFSSPWQLDTLGKWGDTLCFDNVHACGRNTNLYTLVVRDKEIGCGIPCAFFLTKIQTSKVLEGWLCSLKAKMDEMCSREFQPVAVFTNQGYNEIDALRIAFSNQLRVFYSAWNVLEAWECNLTTNNLNMAHLSTEERKQRKGMVRAKLEEILYSKTEDQANNLITTFKETWKERVPNFLDYLDKQFFHGADRQQWMFCYRQGIFHARINTNNYIESWRKAFNDHLSKDKQQRRIDSVIHILVEKVIPDLRELHTRRTVHIKRMTPEQREILVAKQSALDYIEKRRLQDPDAPLLFQTPGDCILRVRSFTNPSIFYDLKIEQNQGEIGQSSTCSCSSFSSGKTNCKHIALANLELPNMDFYQNGHLGSRDDSAFVELLSAEMGHPIATDLSAATDQSMVTDASTATGPSTEIDFSKAVVVPPMEIAPPSTITPTTLATLTPSELAVYYIRNLNSMLETLDTEQPLPNHEEIIDSLKRASDLCEKHFPILLGHNTNNKRARQG
ncbi:hypothetical protein BGZ79_000653 [Entomortierella chlamydospora]|nr:hypothetical protein BGZ79_000653 [Entomortierella chlamydospora]